MTACSMKASPGTADNIANELMKHLIEYPGIIYMIGARVLQSENKSSGLAGYLSISDARLSRLCGS